MPQRRSSGRPRVLVVTGSVGAGHDGAAHELAARLRGVAVDVDVLDLLDVLPGPARRLLRDGYRVAVDRTPWLFEGLFRALEGAGPARAAMLRVSALGAQGIDERLRRGPYDAVVSTYPLASQCLALLRRRGQAPMPLVTYLTDPAVHRSWVEPDVDVHLTVTAATARQGQARYGVPMTAAGPLVAARFSRAVPRARRQALRDELGLAEGVPAALLVAGSLGLGDVLASARDVAGAGVVPVVLCGRNTTLRDRLVRAVPSAVPLGWRDDVHELMASCDVLVQNAGGLSFTEALVAGLPAVSYRCIPGHGQANAAVLHGSGLAPWARTPAELRDALGRQLAAGRTRAVLQDPTSAVLALLPAGPPLAASA